MLLLSSKSREQKNLAPRFPSPKVISASVWTMVDFPVPARPLSQSTRLPCLSSSHPSSCRRKSLLVPLRHPCLFSERCPAQSVWRMLFRRIWSISPYSRVITHHQTTRKKGSRWVEGSCHRYLVVTKSGMDLRHVGGGFVLITNLILHYGIANVFNQTTQLIRILDVVEKSLSLPLLCQRLEFS